MLGGQTPFCMVHEKFVVENGEPAPTVTLDVARFTFERVLVPAKVVQVPVPTEGMLPAKTVVLPQMVKLEPAAEGDGFV